MPKPDVYKRDSGYKKEYLGSDGAGFDFKVFGDTSGQYIRWNPTTGTFEIVGTLTLTGTFNTGNIALIDDETITFGTGLDVVVKWDGTNLLFTGAVAGSSLKTSNLEINQRARFELFDDFTYQAIAETYTPWILNSGSDAQAIDPAIGIQEEGVVVITTGDADGAVANDGAQLVCAVPVQTDGGGLVVEARLHINTAITEVSVNFGLTDVTTLEEPFSIATTTITSVATDAVCFVYDDGATTKEWFACAVDSDTDDTGNGATGSAPVADTYQVLRIEISADGATIKFFVDGTLVKTLSGAAGVSPSTNLYATVIACATTTTSKTVDVDYIYVGHNR